MENKSCRGHIFFFIAILVVFALLASGVWREKPAEQKQTISVSGEYETFAAPDKAEIYFRVETQKLTAKDAQDLNSEYSDAAIASLKKAGVASADIETTDYRIEKVRDWNPQTYDYEDKGYRATHVFKVTTLKIEDVGTLLQVAVDAGVNSIDDVVFSLSKEKERDVKTTVMQQAATKAKEKAIALASSLDVKLGKVVSVTESSYSYVPYRYGLAETAMISSKAAPAPQISPEQVQVSATVSVSFEIE